MSKTDEDEPLDGFAKGARPLCAFCNAPWSDDMIRTFNYSTEESGYYDEVIVEYSFEVKIECHSCNRLIYQKTCEDGRSWRNWKR